MPSSTSSSDPSARAPERPWGRIWAVALACFVVAALALEGFGRWAGLEPNISDSPRLWAHWRAEVSHLDDPVVLLGSSRVQVGVDPELLSAELSRPVVQLALNGSMPLPFLSDLAADQDFRGLVVCGIEPAALFAHRDGWEQKAKDYLAFYRDRAAIERLETPLRLWWESTFVVRLDELSPPNLARTLLAGRMPQRRWVEQHRSRFQAMDYELRPPHSFGGRLDAAVRPISDELAQRRIALIAADVAKIRARGGDVVFVITPTSPESVAATRQQFPPEEYVEPLLAASGTRLIDAATEPSLREFTCPDGGHLDFRDARVFTERLAALLR